MTYPNFTLRLPDWVDHFVNQSASIFSTDQEKMELVIELSRRNINTDGGGPFGAAIFEIGTGKLVAPGVNLVVQCNCSVLHAEMVAIIIAQQYLDTYALGLDGKGQFELVTSTEPCAMCMGAIPWSGITRVLCGARDKDARLIGFNEGDKPPNWQQCFEKRGIKVVCDLCRHDAVTVLQLYDKQQGILYNG